MITHKGTQFIKTERLLLRKIMPDDAEMVYKWMSDSEVLKYEDWEPHNNVDFTRGYISYITGEYKSLQTYLWGIQLGEELIGHILGGSVLAYYLRKNCWSKGYATEAVKAVINYMFAEIGMDRIEAKHSVNNIASGKVLKKAGMIYKGHVKEFYYCNSEWQDCDFYAFTKEQYLCSK
ncbi:MAG: GNAT family N-acetyltransferase [Oscillospiraceae bacterium]|nr:GNAT family N-acetyltransferase [Oscillospiraceae bacterium]